MEEIFKNSKKIIIKIGSSTITGEDGKTRGYCVQALVLSACPQSGRGQAPSRCTAPKALGFSLFI